MDRAVSPAKLQLIGPDEAGNPGQLANAIYDSFRSRKDDRCAIFAGESDLQSLLETSGVDAQLLDPEENFHWKGVQITTRRRWKRVIIGEYLDWFRWYMRWQRFNAFHVVVLFKPVDQVINSQTGGYLDGMLTRLLNKLSLHRAIIVEDPANWPLVRRWLEGDTSTEGRKPDSGRLKQAILATLYGTRLSHTDLTRAVGRTLSSKLDRDWGSVLSGVEASQLVRRRNNFRLLDEDAMKMVQRLGKVIAMNEEEPRPDSFQLSRKREHLRGDDDWIEQQVLSLVEEQGWFTMAVLNDRVRARFEALFSSPSPPPPAIRDQLERGPEDPPIVTLPSLPVLRRIAARMVGEDRLAESTWYREVGRPSEVYHKAGFAGFDQDHRCGQCAFYISLRRHCRLWWLLDKSFGTKDPRWAKGGEHPLSALEIYKMRNAWRISPHSSACTKFTDKKKDHPRSAIPENCEICDVPLRPSKLAICTNCRTRYAKLKRGVRVFPAYEHEFERNYREIAGRDPASDITMLEQERRQSVPRVLEQIHYESHHKADDEGEQRRTLIIYPGDRMLVREGKLYIFKRRNVEEVPLAGTTLVNNDAVDEEQLKALAEAGATIRRIPSSKTVSEDQGPRIYIGPMVERAVVERPEYAQSFALAMAKSALHATERIAAQLKHQYDAEQASVSLIEQRRLLGRLGQSEQRAFLTYEALIMKQYWRCFNLPLRLVFERFGPRKRSRFVRENVVAATGRARGYSAVDAAINYLHQRRLFRCRQVNMQLGLEYNPGEGFLHRRRWNSDGLGLLLDLIDPLKFADREKLLEAVAESRISWHEFYSSTDRQGTRFYYPKPEAVGTLEAVGEMADTMEVDYAGRKQPLMDSYRDMVLNLIDSLKDPTVPFTAFEY